MTMSAPASIAARPSFCCFAVGAAVYSTPQCGITTTTSAPAARAAAMSFFSALTVIRALPGLSGADQYDGAIVS